MRSAGKIVILSMVVTVASIGIVAFLMFFGPDKIPWEGRSLAELLSSGELTPLLIVIGVVMISEAIMLPFLRMMLPREIRNGVVARARVLRVWDTGVSINDNPQVGLQLEIPTPEGSSFQAEAKTLVSRLNVALVQPGVEAEVKYDPQNPKRMQVMEIHLPDLNSGGAAARLEELNDLRDKGLVSLDEYDRKREEILKAL